MAGLPFAYLRDTRRGRFLVDDYSLSLSPTASFYVAQQRRHGKLDHRDWSVLAVDGASPTATDAEQLPLSGGNDEIAFIMRRFPRSEVMPAGQKIPKPPSGYGFHISNAPRSPREHAVVHFAGHWDPGRPTYDALFQADSLPVGRDARLVRARGLQHAARPLGRPEGGFGLAFSHLSSGVPTVLASLWQMDDRATSRLMIRFYEHLHAGKDVANSLRAAQLELLRQDDSALRAPRAWAGMQVLGFGGI